MTDGSPLRTYVPLWGEVVEGVLADARQTLVEPRRAELTGTLERALEAMQGIEESAWSDPRHIEWLDVASVELGAALTLFAGTASEAALHRRLSALRGEVCTVRDQTIDGLARLRGEQLRAGLRSGAVPARGFVASTGVPAVFPLQRAFVPLLERSPTDIDLDQAWRDLEEEARRAETEGHVVQDTHLSDIEASSFRAPSELRHPLYGLARDCLEEIGAMGLLRVVRDDSIHGEGVRRFEDRLLHSLDGLMSLGWRDAGAPEEESLDVIAVTQGYANDGIEHDSMRTFARTFVLCSVAGADGVRAAVRKLRSSPRASWEAQRDAMALSGHPEVSPAMRRLASEGDADLALFALSVLRWRSEVDFGACTLALAHPSAVIRAEAARGLTFVDGRAAATDLLVASLEDELDTSARLAAAVSLVVLDAPTGLAALRGALDGMDPGAAPEEAGPWLGALAVAGGSADLARLSRWASDQSSWVAAVGWFGHVALIEPMLAQVAGLHEGSPAQVAAAHAIERITGERLIDDAEAFGHRPSFHLSPRQWPAWWAEHTSRYDATVKLRFGRPFAMTELLSELARFGVTGADREMAALELAICTAGRARIETRDWMARQQKALVRSREVIASDGRALHRAGEWAADRLGRRS